MQQKAKVQRLLPDGRAELTVVRKSACSGDCGSCGGCGAVEQSLCITADNPIRAGVGDVVYVESATGLILKAAALVYLLPLMLFLAGYFLTSHWGSWAYATAVFGLLVGLIPAVLFDRMLRRRPVKYTVVSFVN